MEARIDLITIFTEDVNAMVRFYRDVLGFEPQQEFTGEQGYVEFKHTGVRFAICNRAVMRDVVGHPSFSQPRQGQPFELAFPCESPDAVDAAYADLIAKGATPVKSPANMPWNQRTALFADPDGNIHEIFAPLASS
ncbi:MAG: VOC family protein [Anaerolineae bacterium]|nr:VOC family protein [Anaerolineae bacterium]